MSILAHISIDDFALASMDDAIALLGIHSRERATRANESAIPLAAAKMAGLEGDNARRVFEHVNESLVGTADDPLLAGPK